MPINKNKWCLQVSYGDNVTSTFLPWALNPATPGAPAVRTTTNARDNVEQVVTASAASNQVWRVTVKAKSGTTIYGDDGVSPGYVSP